MINKLNLYYYIQYFCLRNINAFQGKDIFFFVKIYNNAILIGNALSYKVNEYKDFF